MAEEKVRSSTGLPLQADDLKSVRREEKRSAKKKEKEASEVRRRHPKLREGAATVSLRLKKRFHSRGG